MTDHDRVAQWYGLKPFPTGNYPSMTGAYQFESLLYRLWREKWAVEIWPEKDGVKVRVLKSTYRRYVGEHPHEISHALVAAVARMIEAEEETK